MTPAQVVTRVTEASPGFTDSSTRPEGDETHVAATRDDVPTESGVAMKSLARLVLIGLISLAPLVSGCDYRSVSIQIPGFDAFAVEGIWFWKLDPATGQYERAGGIRLLRDATAETSWPQLASGAELIAYSNTTQEEVVLPAEVIRDPAKPDEVTLRLLYLNSDEPGVFKATIFNAAGESELSDQTIAL